MKWNIPQKFLNPKILVPIALCLIPLFVVFDFYIAREEKALHQMKMMISLEDFALHDELSEKKWSLEKTTEKKMGRFCKVSYQIECQEPLLLEEIKVLLHHPEFFSNLTTIKSHFCFYEKILLDRSDITNPECSSFKASWCCYIPADS